MRKLPWAICVCLITTACLNFTAVGQIKIPKIFNPKQNPPIQNSQNPTTENPSTQNPLPSNNRRQSAEQSGTISQMGGNNIDDGFTWFEAVSFQEPINGTVRIWAGL
jgi:hypothetical protein